MSVMFINSSARAQDPNRTIDKVPGQSHILSYVYIGTVKAYIYYYPL